MALQSPVSEVPEDTLSARLRHLDVDAQGRARQHGWAERLEYSYADPGVGSSSSVAWAADGQKYEWKEEYGDVGPVDLALEHELFGKEYATRMGDHFNTLVEIPVTLESETRVTPIRRFDQAGLHPVMLENIAKCNYQVPTPIQAYVIPSVLQNKDVIGIAQTGSGKTAAYLIPVLSKLMGNAKRYAAPRPGMGMASDALVRAEPLVLIVVPTRELAAQIYAEACRLCYRSMLRPCLVYGGAPSRQQAEELKRGCDVLIAVPGRLIDFLNRGTLLSLNRVRYTIIDEADELISADWQDEMDEILAGDMNQDTNHLHMMFSATFKPETRRVAREYLASDHIRVRIGRAGSTHQNIKQTVLFVDKDKKRDCLYDLLLSVPPARVMIFVNSKKVADLVDDYLYNRGLPSTSIHSDRTQLEREDAIRAFKSGKAPLLVATGVTARGLDIANVEHVVNYDLPSAEYGGIDEYVHRIGRTARIGNDGIATSFYNDDNEYLAEPLAKTLHEMGQTIPDFLQSFAPPKGEVSVFEDDSDKEEEECVQATGAEGGWGDDSGDNPVQGTAGEEAAWI